MTDERDPFGEQDVSGVPEGLPCVELEFATLRRFREEMAPYLNYDGFFARTDHPLPRGTTVEFKFVMPEEFILAQGTAVVSWAIEPEGNPDLVPGMALRFGQVGKQSRAVIDELVDFHIATGGDPFDVGPRAGSPGEIPTDSLAGTGGGAPSVIDSPAPTPRDLPLPPDPERPAPVEEGVLPDWLSDPSGSGGQKDPGSGETSAPSDAVGSLDGFDFQSAGEERPAAASGGDSFDFSAGSSGDEFEVDMIFENGEKDVTPMRPEDGSFQQMAMAPKPANKPPRDMRLGLLVTVAIVLLAAVVLVWSFWLRTDDQEVVQSLPQEEVASDVGVALIEDDGEILDASPGGSDDVVTDSGPDSASQVAAETAARVAAGLASDDEEKPVQEAAVQETTVPGSQTDLGTPTREMVTEQAPEVVSAPVSQRRASKVVDVVAAARGDSTTVVIRGNGVFAASALRTLRLKDPDRLWVGVSPIETFYKPNEIEVGSPDVHRVRIGYHPEDSPPALYVVLDLTGDGVVLLDSSVQGDAIRLTVGRK